MRKFFTAALAVLALGAGAAATSADARDWHDGGWHEGEGRDHDGWRGHDGWRDHDWHGGWGREGWRVGYGRFYGPPAYFAGPDFWGFYDGCRTHWRWNPYWGRYVRVTACY